MRFALSLALVFLGAVAHANNYCNGQFTESSGIPYWPNGQFAMSSGIPYYPNGQFAMSSGIPYWPNGQFMKSSGIMYYPNGQFASSSGSPYYPNGQFMKSSGVCYYENGQSIGTCPATVRVHVAIGMTHATIHVRTDGTGFERVEFAQPLGDTTTFYDFDPIAGTFDSIEAECKSN